MADDWGPWIDHDGKGCPVPVGTFLELMQHSGTWGNVELRAGVITAGTGPRGHLRPLWTQIHPEHGPTVIRYRIRKPRGLRQLQQLVADPGGPVAPDIAPDRVPETTP